VGTAAPCVLQTDPHTQLKHSLHTNALSAVVWPNSAKAKAARCSTGGTCWNFYYGTCVSTSVRDLIVCAGNTNVYGPHAYTHTRTHIFNKPIPNIFNADKESVEPTFLF
jgi:hypothetical protein